MFSKLSAAELGFLILLLVALSVLVQLAVAKALYDRKQARLKRERAEHHHKGTKATKPEEKSGESPV